MKDEQTMLNVKYEIKCTTRPHTTPSQSKNDFLNLVVQLIGCVFFEPKDVSVLLENEINGKG